MPALFTSTPTCGRRSRGGGSGECRARWEEEGNASACSRSQRQSSAHATPPNHLQALERGRDARVVGGRGLAEVDGDGARLDAVRGLQLGGAVLELGLGARDEDEVEACKARERGWEGVETVSDEK